MLVNKLNGAIQPGFLSIGDENEVDINDQVPISHSSVVIGTVFRIYSTVKRPSKSIGVVGKTYHKVLQEVQHLVECRAAKRVLGQISNVKVTAF